MYQPIPGWEEYYEIDEHGSVRNKVTGKLLKGDLNNAGYPRVTLRNCEHVPAFQHLFRHRLVAQLFIPNPNNLPEVDHIDSDILNYDVSNLRWVTKAENEFYSHIIGSKAYRPILVEMIDGIHVFDFMNEVAKTFDVSVETIKSWIDGKNESYTDKGICQIKYFVG